MMNVISFLLIFVLILPLGREQIESGYHLNYKKKCDEKDIDVTICASGEPNPVDEKNVYHSFCIYFEKIECPTREELEIDERKKWNKRKYSYMCLFDYRIADGKLYLPTYVPGTMYSTDPRRQGDFVFFDLRDKIGTKRFEYPEWPKGSMYSILIKKSLVGADSLFTFKVNFQTPADMDYVEYMTFDKQFKLRSFTYNDSGFSVYNGKSQCELDSVMYFN